MMDKLPLISVIVPMYNAEKYIGRCIESVQKQNYQNWEMIIIDDGSTDDSLERVVNVLINDKRIKVVHTENGGVSRARNLGLEIAIGDYIFFLDADDELEVETLKKLYELCVEENADVSIGQHKGVKANGEEIYNHYSEFRVVWKQSDALEKSLMDHPATYSVWGKLYKKEVIGNTRFVLDKKIHEDSFFIFELFLKSPTVVVKDEIIYRYYVTEDSASRAEFSEKFLDILYFVNKKQEIIERRFPEYRKYLPNLVIKANMALLFNLCKTTDRKYKNIEKKCLFEIKKYKDSFVASTDLNKKWFWILTHHLYKWYKCYFLIKRTAKGFLTTH